jgi:hypothetical protein
VERECRKKESEEEERERGKMYSGNWVTPNKLT